MRSAPGLLLTLALGLAPQDPAAEPLCDLRLNVEVGQAIAASLKVNVDGGAKVRAGSKVIEKKLETVMDVQFVDEFSLLEEDRWEATRTYARWFETEEGVVTDSELNGVRARFKLEGNEHLIELDDRLIRRKTLDGLLEQAASVGVWFGLPQAVPIGEEFSVEATSLISLLTDAGFELTDTSGSFALKSVDEEQVATLIGRLSAVEKQESFTSTYEGDWTMEVDIPGGRLVRLEWKGTTRVSGNSDGMTVEGSASFDVNLSTELGVAAKKMLKRKPVYRDVPRELAREGIRLELPSHWLLLTEEELVQFQTSLHGADTPVTMEFMVLEISPGTHDEVIAAGMKAIEADVGKITEKKVTSPLGKGRSARYEVEGHEVLLELYPLGTNRILRLRLLGKPAQFFKELKHWKKMWRSLEELDG